ncbi:hypothetical protein ACFV3R_13490 [Streptomyces sp. NPDC059740]|uniref:hypothetical protein n=1 Tax=Streptomyces sp. NPDC059740 TaxID=3346926 RepID=UPI00364623F1
MSSPTPVPHRTTRPPRPARRGLHGGVCAALLALGGGLALTACAGDPDAGTNGVGKLPARTIEARARSAAESARSVRLAGDLVSKGRTYRFDLTLAADGARGKLSTGSAAFQLLRVGKALYVKADADFWAQQGGGSPSASDRAAAKKLDGKYVKVPSSDPAYRRFSGFTEKNALLGSVLTLHGTLTTGPHGTVGGTRSIHVDGDKGDGGAWDVSLEGRPYPLRLSRAGGAGVVRLSEWGHAVQLKAPTGSQVVDYGKQITAGE